MSFLEPLNIRSAKYLFIPVNDSTTVDILDGKKQLKNDNGSHWSLLVYEKSTNKFYYYDSIKNYNMKAAKSLAEKCSAFLSNSTDEKAVIETVDNSPQQQNTYDCTIYTVIITEQVIGYLRGNHGSAGHTLADLSFTEIN